MKLTMGGINSGFGNLLGFKNAGFDIKYLIDDRGFILKCKKSLEKHLGLVHNENFISTMDLDNKILKEKVDVIMASPSCAQFSKLGMKRTDRKDLNSLSLIDLDFVKSLDFALKQDPKILILEYVPDILKKVDLNLDGIYHLTTGEYYPFHSDYVGFQIILNAMQYGLSQKRERVFLFIMKKDLFRIYSPPIVPPQNMKVGMILKHIDALRDKGELLNDIHPVHSEKRIHGFMKLAEGSSYYGTINNRKLNRDEYAPVITSSKTQYIHPWHPRVLTVREAATFQGFDFNLEFCENSFSDLLDLIGKTVSPVITQDIANFCAESIEKYEKNKI